MFDGDQPILHYVSYILLGASKKRTTHLFNQSHCLAITVLPVMRILPNTTMMGPINRRKRSASNAAATQKAYAGYCVLMRFRISSGTIADMMAPTTTTSHSTEVWDNETPGSAEATAGNRSTIRHTKYMISTRPKWISLHSFIIYIQGV